MLCLKLALKSGKLEEYKVAKAIIQYALPGLLVTKWPCLRGQSVRTGQKIVRGDKFVFKHSSSQQRLVQGVLVVTLKFEIPQVTYFWPKKISKKLFNAYTTKIQNIFLFFFFTHENIKKNYPQK